jgi:O-antigen ligase
VEATIVGGAVAGLLLIAQYVAGGFALASRYTIAIGGSAVTDPNGAAVSLLVPLALAVCLALGCDRRLPTIASALSAILCAFGIALTESRTGLLSMTVALLAIVLGARRAGATRGRRHGLGLLLVIGVFALLALNGGALLLRVQEAFQTGGTGRLAIWTVGLAAAKEYWATGAGLETFSHVYTRFAYMTATAWRGVDRSAHNIYLAALVETGVAGLVLMIGLLWSHFSLMQRMDSEVLERRKVAWWRLALVASVLGLAVSGLTLDVFWRKWFWWALMLCVGLAQVGSRHLTNELDV